MKRVLMDHEKEGFPITALREIKILQTLNRKTNDYGSSTDSDNPIGHENWFGWVLGIFLFFFFSHLFISFPPQTLHQSTQLSIHSCHLVPNISFRYLHTFNHFAVSLQ